MEEEEVEEEQDGVVRRLRWSWRATLGWEDGWMKGREGRMGGNKG